VRALRRTRSGGEALSPCVAAAGSAVGYRERKTILPSTTVATGQPVRRIETNGEFRLFPRNDSGFTVRTSAGSKIVMSAG
jgi:hypothetical protein